MDTTSPLSPALDPIGALTYNFETMPTPEQLYLFEVPAAPPARTETIRLGAMHLRTDQAMLLLIFGLIGLSVVFAVGVERGRKVAQAEQSLLAPRGLPSQEEPRVDKPGQIKASSSEEAAKPSMPRQTAPSPTPVKRTATPVKLAESAVSRYAIQVVSYRQPLLAQQELQRLQQRGERAFLITREGRTMLLVGPFPSKQRAATKLASLRQQYRDCFVRSL